MVKLSLDLNNKASFIAGKELNAFSNQVLEIFIELKFVHEQSQVENLNASELESLNVSNNTFNRNLVPFK